MCIFHAFFRHFEVRVASRDRSELGQDQGRQSFFKSIWVIKVQIVSENGSLSLELFKKSYEDVNEHEEWEIDFTERADFWESKHI